MQSAFWQFQTVTESECCLTKLLSYILFEKYIYISAVEMTGPENQHCANCIGTFTFPVTRKCAVVPTCRHLSNPGHDSSPYLDLLTSEFFSPPLDSI